MLDKAKQYLIENALLGLSGGPDSIALFHLLLEAGVSFRVCHVDHGWRKESRDEALKLATLCQSYSIPFHLAVLENFDYEKGNLEDRFREERYRIYKRLYFENQCKVLLLGHHKDDQAETILKRIFEGGSFFSLGGMKCRQSYEGMAVVRPLFYHTKAEILDYLQAKKIAYFMDSTNRDPKYLRARMREEMLPYLEQTFGKNIRENLVLLGERMGHIAEYLEMRISSILKDAKIELDAYVVKLPKDLHPLESEYLLRLIGKKMDFSLPRGEIEKMQTILEEGKSGKKVVTGECEIVYERDHLYCRKPQKKLQSNVDTKNLGLQ